MSTVYPKVGGIVSPANYIGAFTWALKPAASAALAGATAYMSDVGASGYGSYWYCDGARWRAVGGRVILRSTAGSSATASGTAEILEQTSALPAGLIQNGDSVQIRFGAVKSNTAATTTASILLGATTATSETVLWSAPYPATANVALITQAILTRVNATTIRRAAWQSTSPYSVGAAYPADVTVANMDSTALYLGLMFANSAAETTASKFCAMELMT